MKRHKRKRDEKPREVIKPASRYQLKQAKRAPTAIAEALYKAGWHR